jgi:hypothetical protein
MTMQGEHDAFVAMLDCLILGITEAITDHQLERPIRVPMPDAYRAYRIAEDIAEAIRLGDHDE